MEAAPPIAMSAARSFCFLDNLRMVHPLKKDVESLGLVPQLLRRGFEASHILSRSFP